MNIVTAWQQLSSRDKLLAAGGTTLLLLFLFYSLFWQPMNNRIHSLQKDISSNRELLAWMQVQVPEFISLKSTHKGPMTKLPQGSLLTQVDASLKQNGQTLEASDLSQIDTKTVHLAFKSVPFNDMMQWYETFVEKFPIVATSVSIKALEESGLVQADFTLTTQ